MKTFKEYLEIAHIGKGYLNDKVHKHVDSYLKGDYVGGYLGHPARFHQLDLIIQQVLLEGKGHLTHKQLGELLSSESGRHLMDELSNRIETSAREFFTSKREEIINAIKKTEEEKSK